MIILDNDTLRTRLFGAFPKAFINSQLEFIAHPARNTYFLLKDVDTEEALDAKVIEWLSRHAVKGGTRQSMAYHLNGINKLLGTDFSPEEMEKIYTKLGNAVNHDKTLQFIRSGYDLKIFDASEAQPVAPAVESPKEVAPKPASPKHKATKPAKKGGAHNA